MNKKVLLKRILHYIGNQKLLVCFSLLLAAVYVTLTLLVPIYVGKFIDGLPDFSLRTTVVPLAVIGAAAAVSALSQWGMSHLNNKITCKILENIRSDSFAKLQKLPFSYLDRTPTGDTVSRLMTDADNFSDGLLMGFTQLFTGVLTILGTIIFMLSMSPKVTLAVVLLTPLSLFVSRFVANGTYKFFKKQAELRSDLTAYTEELVIGRNTVRAFGREEVCIKKFDMKNEKLRKVSAKAVFLSSLVNPVTRFLNALVYAAVALIGALICVNAEGGAQGMTVGMLSTFLAYANQYTKPFNEISGVIAELQNAFACAGRIFNFLDEQEEVPDADPAKPLKAKGNVGAEHVYFSYDPEKSLIEDFNLQVQSGQKIAIVGPTGCGKTTLINLLMRFYDPQKGQMTLEGENIQAYTRRDLRTSYGMVLQDNWIGKMTVRDNIRRGKPDATDEEVIAAAKAAHAHGFISHLPKGYDTVLEENGEGMSAGQRQLLCIAAVMLCHPPMLILDEATASIDTRTEMKIQDAFARLMEGRTSFIVAHRLSTIRDSDKILVMDKGKIVETGTHEELLKKGGFYADLYNAQFA